jgi:hypothetical protein
LIPTLSESILFQLKDLMMGMVGRQFPVAVHDPERYPIMCAVLRIIAAMIDINPNDIKYVFALGDLSVVLNGVIALTHSALDQIEMDTLMLYSDCLRVWNRIINYVVVELGDMEGKFFMENGCEELVRLLVHQFFVEGSPQIEIMLILADLMRFPSQLELFQQYDGLEMLEACFNNVEEMGAQVKNLIYVMLWRGICDAPAAYLNMIGPKRLELFLENGWDMMGDVGHVDFLRAMNVMLIGNGMPVWITDIREFMDPDGPGAALEVLERLAGDDDEDIAQMATIVAQALMR